MKITLFWSSTKMLLQNNLRRNLYLWILKKYSALGFRSWRKKIFFFFKTARMKRAFCGIKGEWFTDATLSFSDTWAAVKGIIRKKRALRYSPLKIRGTADITYDRGETEFSGEIALKIRSVSSWTSVLKEFLWNPETGRIAPFDIREAAFDGGWLLCNKYRNENNSLDVASDGSFSGM